MGRVELGRVGDVGEWEVEVEVEVDGERVGVDGKVEECVGE